MKINKVLVLNCGSSSIKYELFDSEFNSILLGEIEDVDLEDSRLIHNKEGKTLKKKVEVNTYRKGIDLILDILHDEEWGVLKDMKEISVVGHRVVHGGKMEESTVISKDVLEHLKEFEILAPLHNPHNLLGVREADKAMPGVPQVMVFDTQFHQTMPKKAYMYGLPYEFLEKYSVRKYGFHGMSHQYVSERAAEILGKKPNLITCHLGSGASLAAIKNGKSVDTSMGMTPLEGVMMDTRTGDIDPTILQYLNKKYDIDYDEIFEIMNNKSGLLGISGESIDPRVINKKAKKGNKRCKLALEMYCYRIAKYIGAYSVALGKVDGIIFTAGIGAGSPFMRKRICSYLDILGVKLNSKKNKKAVDKEMKINSRKSEVKVMVIPTNEELIIAKEAASVMDEK